MESCDLLCLDIDAAEAIRAKLDPAATSKRAATLKLFADPTRLLIAQALAEQELCGCDLAWITGTSEKVVSHHLGRLRAHGLVAGRREGKVVFASLTVEGRTMLDVLAEVIA